MKIIFLFLMLLSSSISAAPSTPKVWGYGINRCSTYTETYKGWEANKEDQIWEYIRYRDWLTGLVTGLSLASGMDVLNGVEPKGAMRRISLHCEEHPKDDFFAATMGLIRLLGMTEEQQTSGSEHGKKQPN